ncbi:RidA family protein [Paremcibacter congregatus]|uniref:RidA family protein n=1 Tax=Paremcibacter congregatus TaxID=2043170 RepID=UPI003A8E1006
MSVFQNPFNASDVDRVSIWEILVHRDIDAFLASDWPMTAVDFIEEGFYGIDGKKVGNPDEWRLTFPDLESYKKEWLRQAADAAIGANSTTIRAELFAASRLKHIDINGNTAVAHKEIKGAVTHQDGSRDILDWQTLYVLRKVDGSWKIASFVGYMPSVMGGSRERAIQAPNATQHITAGPYSPVLSIKAGELVVISGQAPINMAGEVVGDTIEEQTRYTLDCCLTQLKNADCDFSDVFKVNVYLTNLDEWDQFNEIYKEYMSAPYPARATVQAGLLYTFKVEIEMWAAKK